MWARSQRMERTVRCVALMTARPMKFVACARGFPYRLRRVSPRRIPFFLSTSSSSPSSFISRSANYFVCPFEFAFEFVPLNSAVAQAARMLSRREEGWGHSWGIFLGIHHVTVTPAPVIAGT